MNNTESHAYFVRLRKKIYEDMSDNDMRYEYDVIACELLNVLDELLPDEAFTGPVKFGHG